MSKGSRQRPTAETFRDNWDRIFGDSKEVVESVDGNKADMEVVDIEEEKDGLDNG